MVANARQNGSTEAVLIVILVLALLSALGWIFWQNFMQPANTNNTASAPQPSASSSVAAKNIEHCLSGAKLCFDYPSSWKIEKTTESYPAEGSQDWKDNGNKSTYDFEGVKIMSNDQTAKLHLETGIGQLGGTCDPQASGQLSVIDSEDTAIKTKNMQGQDATVRAVSVILQKDGKYGVGVFLTNQNNIQKGKDISACETGYADLIEQKFGAIDGFNNMRFSSMQMLDGSVKIYDNSSLSSVDEAKKALKSPHYLEAFEVLQSVKYAS